VDIKSLVETLPTDRWTDADAFGAAADAVLAYQRDNNPVYNRYCKKRQSGNEPHYLPVEAFKHIPVTTFPPENAEHIFESSGTGRGTPSRHYVRSLDLYERVTAAHFQSVFGQGPFTFVAHLPGYADNGKTSSLLYMVDHLIYRFGDVESGFFLDDRELLHVAIGHSRASGSPFLLFGAAFGLLDLVEDQRVALPEGAVVIETGGMKTHRQEITRDALHARLADGFSIDESQVYSEYGMCELMSQCYTRGDHIFYPPPWMRFQIMDPEDPRQPVSDGEVGALALFDLANVYTVSPLLTEDRAVRVGNGFNVLGRLSDAELRGCNFLVESALRN
jgi:hypothetical protein